MKPPAQVQQSATVCACNMSKLEKQVGQLQWRTQLLGWSKLLHLTKTNLVPKANPVVILLLSWLLAPLPPFLSSLRESLLDARSLCGALTYACRWKDFHDIDYWEPNMESLCVVHRARLWLRKTTVKAKSCSKRIKYSRGSTSRHKQNGLRFQRPFAFAGIDFICPVSRAGSAAWAECHCGRRRCPR